MSLSAPPSPVADGEDPVLRAKKEATKLKREETKRIRHTWKSICRTEIPKVARNWITSNAQSIRQSRLRAAACAREARKGITNSVRLADEALRRSRKLLKDVMSFWKKEDRERLERKKKELLEIEAQRRKEDEEREVLRQRNKLRFLLGQSEAFSSFLQKKSDATAKLALGTGVADLESVTGTEDDAELMSKAQQGAAALVADHKARLEKFDAETRKRRGDVPIVQADNEVAVSKEVVQQAESAVHQPKMLNGKMKEYQLRGLAWLVSLYDQGINGILADEMGLGKTIQTISFFAYLTERENNWGPFLVVTPKATLHNWQQEIEKFCPTLRCLPYWGTKTDRQELRKVWSAKRMYRKDSEFHVCVTSYEILLTDEKHFPRVKWQYMVLDEAQAIKNSSSSRWKVLLSFPCRNRLLLTGTPLQNKLSELWSLLHFIMPTIFDSHAEFAEWFAKDIEGHATQNSRLDAQTINRLRTLLDPFMLRRVKRDVENEMPPKTEVELPCYLTPRQRMLYSVIKQNISVTELLKTIGGQGNAQSEEKGRLMNIVMQLRKVCNHPETFERRQPITPLQFQLPSPPSFVPPPPSILTSNSGPPPALDVSFMQRSAVSFELPKLMFDFQLDAHERLHRFGNKLAVWSAALLVDRWFPKKCARSFKPVETISDGYGLARLSGGVSVGEFERLMYSLDVLWYWHDVTEKIKSTSERLIQTYGDSENGPIHRPHHILMNSCVNLRNSSVILPSFGSSAELLERSSRLIRTCRVFVPPSVAPAPFPHYPGSGRESKYVFDPISTTFVYPDPPQLMSVRPTEEYNAYWRELFDTCHGSMDTFPVLLPESGRLIVDSGKMKALDQLLTRLKSEGHKCLLYSQFTKVLDILEDYCVGANHKFLRLDGQSALADRRDMVAEFQSNPELFIFLLSTRAGGVGINLTAADTVIFYDSDWNPTVDAQAMDRAHRVGQEKPVTVYRLISKGTIEERIRRRAKEKHRVHELVIRGQVTETEANTTSAELTDVAALLLGEEDIGMKARLAGAH
uniref:Chromatin-remodeling ATPase INO80 n=1 Tax=Timspurckia oligopyrenoides TaxID=708627 RepID=A0A7S0ZBG1_9RHOD